MQTQGEPYEFEVPVKNSKIALYTVIAFIVCAIVYHILVREPSLEWPTNIIHLLVRH
ncbi:protein of unknown function [Trichlorobacter ammonificans]|uniref:Uncharacterized protein n=1 Tax=Trichlorobacter ammonificans TaxID=2916410 RepID=A0ABM9D9C5_9BACT|nr:protein of unknown function [Trichlorobacter ammonificans]